MSDWSHKDLEGVRREFKREQLDESSLPADPFTLFEAWMEEALSSDTPDPTAMILSTADESASPSSRIVLLKKIHKNTLVFFSSYQSKKARDIKANSRVAAHFYWPFLERQVKIAGIAEEMDDAESDRYFSSRPFESKVSAWASPQSEVIPDREYLENEYRRYYQDFKAAGEVPRPAYWGAFAISPHRMEFWQGGRHRLHDRIEYRMVKDGWSFVRLAP